MQKGGSEKLNFRFVDVIAKKKHGIKLSQEEIQEMIARYTNGEIPDYQMSAMLMAICFQGLDDEELAWMTLAMRDSGDSIDLSAIEGVKVDKHSTGGVGDKTTLIIGPIVAACGVPVAKMSGRGLGFTGGTIDKLESIPGLRTDIAGDKFFQAVNEVGVCVAGQTANLAPADKLLYALRDVTATVDSIPLIAASVMSKKLAAGSDKILLDVTTGSGAFIQNIEESKQLAGRMVAIGTHAGKETVALITGMDEPLGHAIGNNLEVKEAIEALQGCGPADLMEVCYALAGNMIYLAGAEPTLEEAKERARKTIEDGSAWKRFVEMVRSQGGDVEYVLHPEHFPMAAYTGEVPATVDGYMNAIQTDEIGRASGILGAGRATKDSVIDMSAGILWHKKLGDQVKAGESIATLYTEHEEYLEAARTHIQENVTIGTEQIQPKPLVRARIAR